MKIKKGMKVLVVGLGRSGASAVKLLCKKGAKVTVTDLRNKSDLTSYLEELEGYDYKAEFGKHVLKSFSDQDLIVVSPGVPLDIKPLQNSRKVKVPIISELELASQYVNKPMIAVTGTNGKTTTTHMIAKMVEMEGKIPFLCGNVGRPLSEFVIQRNKADIVVVEVSSFQMDATTTFKPDVAVYLNVAPDHLNRYASYDDYVNAKIKMAQHLTNAEHLVVNMRDAKLVGLLKNHEAKKYYFTSDSYHRFSPELKEKFQGMTLQPNLSLDLHTSRWKPFSFDVKKLKLRGLHNKENVMAAILSAKLVGIHNEAIQRAIHEFMPLPHRMEFVGRKSQVRFYNDSKGTNVHSLMRSLESFQEPVILIAGGQDKGEEYLQLSESIRRSVKNLILVGEAKEKMNRAIGDCSETFLVGTFEEAVYLAFQKARSGDVILLSPGCASYDMFDNFEKRGERFKEIFGTFA